MKILSLIAISLVSVSSFASIIDSDYEIRHQALIEFAVDKECGVMRVLKQESSKINEDRVDQGIVDLTYTTVFIALQKGEDNGIYIKFRAEVVSHRSDLYDHESRNWGVYEILDVRCELMNN